MSYMKILPAAMFSILCWAQISISGTGTPSVQKLNQMPVAFTKNNGQWDDRVLFRASSGGATMWVTREGAVYQFTRRISENSADPIARMYPQFHGNHVQRDSVERLVLSENFVGAKPNSEIIGEELMGHKCNFFLGNDPAKWRTDVPNYAAITLRDIYPGIDLKYSGSDDGQAAYEFIAAPGADIARIKVAYEGAEEISVDADGGTIVRTK